MTVGLLGFGVSTNAAQPLGGRAGLRTLDSPRPTLGYYHDYALAADLDGASGPALLEFSSTDDSTPLSTASAADWFDRFRCFIGLGVRCTGAPEEVLPPPPPPPPPPPQKIVLRGVHFDFEKSIILDVGKPVLDEDAEVLKANPNGKIEVNGYCDAFEKDCVALSKERANSVADYLVMKGVNRNQLTSKGFGTHFVADNANPQDRAQNRRVELVPDDEQ